MRNFGGSQLAIRLPHAGRRSLEASYYTVLEFSSMAPSAQESVGMLRSGFAALVI